jgi:hypothetical protein
MMKRAAIVSLVILLFMAGLSLATDAREVISADDILREIQMKEPIDYQGVIVEGNLDLSKLKMSVVSSPIKITDSQIKGALLFNGILFKKVLISRELSSSGRSISAIPYSQLIPIFRTQYL